MKITQADFVTLSTLVQPVILKTSKTWYEKTGLSMTRYRWDIFHATADSSPEARIFINSLYDYLNDDNIDTALKKLTKTN